MEACQLDELFSKIEEIVFSFIVSHVYVEFGVT